MRLVPTRLDRNGYSWFSYYNHTTIWGNIRHTYFPILNSATAGAGIGLLVGVYDIRSQRRDRALMGLHNSTQDLLEADSKKEACQITVDTAQDIIQLPLTGLWLRDGDQLEIIAISDLAETAFDEHPTFENREGLAWDVYDKQEPKLFENVSDHKDAYNPETQVETEYIVPVGEHGVMISGSFTGNEFSTLQLDLIRLMAAHTELVLDRIEKAETLKSNEEELEQQNERLEQFASVVSHDLQNPLNVIDGYIELARETPEEQYFAEMEAAVNRMSTLIEDLLTLAQTGESIQQKMMLI